MQDGNACSLVICAGTSQPCFSHPLQRLTDEYINDPATRNESNSNREAKDNGDQLTWALGDPPPEESLRPHFQARQTHTDPLIKWILDQGGYIDSHLYIGTSPTLKCRSALWLNVQNVCLIRTLYADNGFPQYVMICLRKQMALFVSQSREMTWLSSDDHMVLGLFFPSQRAQDEYLKVHLQYAYLCVFKKSCRPGNVKHHFGLVLVNSLTYFVCTLELAYLKALRKVVTEACCFSRF